MFVGHFPCPAEIDPYEKIDLSKLCEFCIKSCVELRKVEELEKTAMVLEWFYIVAKKSLLWEQVCLFGPR